MWNDLNEAAAAMRHDGYSRYTAYWWRKRVSGRYVWIELVWRGMSLFPVQMEDDWEAP